MSLVYEITEVCEAHLSDIEEIEKACFSIPWTREQLRWQMTEPGHMFLAAVSSGRVIGYVGLAYVLDEGYISNIAVTADFRRQGVADALLRELEARASAIPVSFATLEVRDSNTSARAFYTNRGFSEVGRIKNYYQAPREDAILMTKFFDTSR